jgi:hypothetical protein
MVSFQHYPLDKKEKPIKRKIALLAILNKNKFFFYMLQ